MAFNFSNIFRSNAPAVVAKRRKKLPGSLTKEPTYRIEMQMNNLKVAVDSAMDVYNPSRNQLYLLYGQSVKDGHVRSQLEIAINKVASLPFKVWDGDTENEDKKYFFKRPWFDQYMRIFIEAELWGYTLMEFGDLVNGEFVDVKTFPRRWVNPYFKEILMAPSMPRGMSYENQLADLFMIEAGDVEDIGTLELICREVIWKNFARTDWSDFNERFGKPIITIATDTDDEQEVLKRAAMAANFGSNLWMVHDIDDTVNILEAKSVSGNADNFEKKIRMCNEEISKIVNGTKGTSDEQAFVGTAKVGERILNDYTKARVRRMSNHINYQLIPFLNSNGYPLQNCTFEFEIEERDKEQPSDEENTTAEPVSKKKSLIIPGKAVSLATTDMKSALKLDDWLKRYFEGKVMGIDPTIWQMNFESLLAAMKDAGISFKTGYNYADMARALRENAAVFSAFKNHKEQLTLKDLLVDADGKPVDFATFRKAAKPITEAYNREWLLTEFKQAQATAQMAVKWEGFQESKDLYPNLRYDAVMDSDTRPDHRRLDGTILPIGDSFWSRNYPPNGWGCRCTVTQTDEPVTSKPSGFKPDDGFEHNAAQDRKLFGDKNGYQKDFDKTEQSKVKTQADTLLNNYLAGDE